MTFTTNPGWPEITENLLPGQRANDRPDLVATVFNLKVLSLLDDLLKKDIFGRVTAHFGTIEYQKRGLPHLHLLILMSDEDRPSTAEMNDRVGKRRPNKRVREY